MLKNELDSCENSSSAGLEVVSCSNGRQSGGVNNETVCSLNDDKAIKNKKKNITQKIVLTAMFAAILVFINIFGTFRIGYTLKFSVLMAVSFFAGVVLGPYLGFFAGVVGDFLGWMLFVDGPYNPFICLASGLFCCIPAILNGLFIKISCFKSRNVRMTVVVLASAVLTYVLCTLLLTSYGVWFMAGMYPENYGFMQKYDAFSVYLGTRALSQLPNNAANAVLSLVVYFSVSKISVINKYVK